MGGLADAGKVAEKEGATAGQRAGTAFSSSLRKASEVGSAAFIGAGVVAVAMAAKFEEGLTTLVTGAGEAEGNLKKVGEGIKTIAVNTGTSTEQLIKGMFMVESAGFHGAAGLKVLQAAAEGAKVGNADLGTVANATTTILNAYHLGAGKATDATNALVSIVSHGKTHMEDLAASISRVLPTSAALHVSMGEVGGAMATMTGQGISAKLAAMGLNSTLLAIAAPSKSASKEMASLGLNSKQVANDLTHKGLVFALDEMTAAAGKRFPVGSAGYVNALNIMAGGHRGLQVMLALTGTHMSTMVANTKAVSGAFDSGAKHVEGWAAVQKDFNFKLAQFKSTAEVAGISLGQKLLPVVQALLGFLAKNAHVIEPILLGLGALSVAYKAASAIKALSVAFSIMEATTPVGWIMLIVAALAVLVTVVIKYHKQISDFITRTWGSISAFVTKAWGDIFSFAKKWWPLIAIAVTGPIGAMAVLIIKYHTDILNFIVKTWNSVLHFFDTVKSAITSGFDKWWASNGEAIKKIWKDVWDYVSAIVRNALAVIEPIVKVGMNVISTAWRAGAAVLSTVWQQAWNVIETIAKIAWDYIKLVFSSAWSVVTAAWKIGWNVLLNSARMAWALIQAVCKIAWDVIVGIFTIAINLLTGRWGAAWNALKNMLVQVWNAIKQLLRSDLDAIINIFQSAWNIIYGAVKSTWNNIKNFISNTLGNIRGGFSTSVAALKSKWNELENIFKAPVNFLIKTVYDNGIRRFWNDIVPHIGGPSLPNVPGLARGRVGQMDGIHRIPGYGGGDRHLALLEAGESVVPKELTPQIAGWMRAHGVPGHQFGWISSAAHAVGNVASSVWGGIKDAGSVVAALATGNGTALANDMMKFIGIDGAKGDYLQGMMRNIPKTMIGMLANWIKKFNLGGGTGNDIVNYAMSFLGKIPYVWGGTSLSYLGADCSGFTGSVYKHFGLNPPRTSEAQGAWVKRGQPTPGGLAFYHSPAGGADPGHVAIVKDPSTVISQGGGMGPKLMALHGMPLLFTGTPPGGFQLGGPGGAVGAQGSLQQIAQRLLNAYGWGGQWPAFDGIEMAEAGWNMNARNPGSGAYGLAQFINGPGDYAKYGGNANTGLGQLTAMMNYIRGRYGDPNAAWAHELGYHWYAGGTNSSAPGWAMVGERGRELVRMPQGSMVFPNGQTERMLGGTPTHIKLEITGGQSEFDQFMMKWIRKHAKVLGGGDVQKAFGAR